MRYQSILASFGLLLCVISAFGQEGKTAEVVGRTGVIQIHQPISRLSTLNKRETSKNFIANQIISVGSQMSIAEASEASDLDKDLLKKSVLVTEVAGTDMAKITILNHDQKTSRDMFDAITSSYMSRWVRSEKIERSKLFGRGTMKCQRHGDL
ncbi:hypothetical protein N9139_00745 [Akkermansiaceae bacterium]|nr:hypothetical protein [Akkermansiaceae bacterium]